MFLPSLEVVFHSFNKAKDKLGEMESHLPNNLGHFIHVTAVYADAIFPVPP